LNVSNELEVEEIIANGPATLEQIFVAEMHPCICCSTPIVAAR
jgi:deoxycytidylate deaminase